MGNGTTCNLQLVKQNAKKKGEVSTGGSFCFLLSLCFPQHVHNAPSASARLFPPRPQQRLRRRQNASRLLFFTGIKSARMEVKDLGGPEGGGATQRKRLVAPVDGGQRQKEGGRGGGGAAAAWQRQNLFITTAPSLSPSRTAQCKCWTFREKITSPGGKGADGEKLSRLQ